MTPVEDIYIGTEILEVIRRDTCTYLLNCIAVCERGQDFQLSFFP